MPKYYRGGTGYVHVRNFENVEQLLHQLILLDGKGFEPYRDMATQYLSGKRIPTRKLKRSALTRIVHTQKPRDLVQHVVREVESHKDPSQNSQLGGGVAEAFSTVTHELLHLTGADVLFDKIFGIKNPNKLVPLEAQFAAYLVDQTYQKIDQRKDETLDRFTRLEKYDTSHCSVWRNEETGQLTLTVRGTKLSMSDIGDDVKILFGKTNVESPEVEQVMTQLETDFPNERYDVASHSLGCSFVFSELEHSDHWNKLYLFNPGSSPFQDTDVLERYANLPNATYFYNSGDVVSDGIRQQASKETLQDNIYFGDYRWSPFAAHSLTQWVPPTFGESDDLPKQKTYDDEPSSFDTTEFQQDTQETRAAGLS